MHRHGHGETEWDWDELWARQEARAPLADRWWELAGGRPGLRVADVGCGPGFFALRYAALVGPTGHVHAVDASPDAVARVLARLDPVHHAHVTTEILDVQDAPLPELGYDAVFLTDVLHHLEHPRRALRHLRETTGALVVAEFNPEGAGEFGPPPEARISPTKLLRMLADAGWSPGEVERQPMEHYVVVARPTG